MDKGSATSEMEFEEQIIKAIKSKQKVVLKCRKQKVVVLKKSPDQRPPVKENLSYLAY